MPVVKLKSSEGHIFDTEANVINCSGTIKLILDSAGDDGGVIPLPQVNSATLERILRWAEHHKNDPEMTDEKLKELKTAGTMPKFEEKFFKIKLPDMYKLIMAANYLHIKLLYHYTTLFIALMIKGKETEQIRKELGIPNDSQNNSLNNMEIDSD